MKGYHVTWHSTVLYSYNQLIVKRIPPTRCLHVNPQEIWFILLLSIIKNIPNTFRPPCIHIYCFCVCSLKGHNLFCGPLLNNIIELPVCEGGFRRSSPTILGSYPRDVWISGGSKVRIFLRYVYYRYYCNQCICFSVMSSDKCSFCEEIPLRHKSTKITNLRLIQGFKSFHGVLGCFSSGSFSEFYSIAYIRWLYASLKLKCFGGKSPANKTVTPPKFELFLFKCCKSLSEASKAASRDTVHFSKPINMESGKIQPSANTQFLLLSRC
jgi:hypothetical protein